MANPTIEQPTEYEQDTQESIFEDRGGHAHEEEPYDAAAIQVAAAEPRPSPLAVLKVDDFAALEERVLSAVSLVRRERQARAATEDRAAALEVQLSEAQSHSAVIEDLQQEVQSLRAERDQVRLRVERLLSQLDALEI